MIKELGWILGLSAPIMIVAVITFPSKENQLNFIEKRMDDIQMQREILTEREKELEQLPPKKSGKRSTMTTINSFSRQPTSLDYASPTQFKFQITKLPKVEYFCTSVNLPVSISEVRQPTPFVDVPLPKSTTLTYAL